MPGLKIFNYLTDSDLRYQVLCREEAETLSLTNGSRPNTDIGTGRPLQQPRMAATRKASGRFSPRARYIILEALPGNSRGVTGRIEVVVFRPLRVPQYEAEEFLSFRGDDYRVVKIVPEIVPLVS